jgi:predicted RNase H-like nuclease (RuvC/YqgF family)
MIDPTEKQTQPLALEQTKRGRGRPATGAAMTPAEKQKAYRERQKASQLEIQERAKAGKLTVLEATRKALDENCKELEKQYRVSKEATARAEKAEADFVTLRKKLDKALATIQELKKGSWWRVIEVKSDVED